MPRYKLYARRQGAEAVLRDGVKKVASDYGVAEASVRRWCKEFNIKIPSTRTLLTEIAEDDIQQIVNSGTNKISTVTEGQQRRLRMLPSSLSLSNLDLQHHATTDEGCFAPYMLRNKLQEVGKKQLQNSTPHKNSLTEFEDTVAGIVEAFHKAKRHASMSRYDDYDQFAELAGMTALRLQELLDACIQISDDKGMAEGLQIFAESLSRWGYTGTDVERLSTRDHGALWDQRRSKAEQAAHTLQSALLEHPENQNSYSDIYMLRRHGNRIEIFASFDKMGREIFTMSFEMMREDWDHPSLTGDDILLGMIDTAITNVGLKEGRDVTTQIRPHEKGHLTISVAILDTAE